MGKKSETPWKPPTIKDLQRAALGKGADLIPDEELDEYAASLIIKESHSKVTMQNLKRANNSSYFFIKEPKVTTATNKTFLANTIKNTSSYNNSLRKREAKDVLTKKRNSETKLEKKSTRSSSFKRVASNVDFPRRGESVTKEYADGDCNEATSESYRRLGQMVTQSKFKTQKNTIQSLNEVLDRSIDPGPYGPIKPVNDNEPNSSLPQKCPW